MSFVARDTYASQTSPFTSGDNTPDPPKQKWWQKLRDAVGTVIGQAKFGGGGN